MRQLRIDYGRLVESALRSVVRDVLARVSREGLPPPHHFYITFRTQAPGVDIPDFLRERYPSDMTIVLQHQFWDLEVDESGFSITLSFSDRPQRLCIPFAAIKVFADPGVEFGLQFTIEAEAEAEVTPLRAVPAGPQVVSEGPGPIAGSGDEGEKEVPEGGAEIVSLDRFRRK